MRTPSRIATPVSVQFENATSNVDFLLPYMRCCRERPMDDYLQAKYVKCTSMEMMPKFAALEDFLPQREQLCSQWRDGGGKILLSTESSGVVNG